MNERYRVRKLTQSGPAEVDPNPQRGTLVTVPFMAMSDQAGAVYEVASNDLELTYEAVVQLLEEGQLSSTDLVFIDGRWMSLVDSVEFEDAAQSAATSEEVSRTVLYVLMLIGATAVGGFFLWLAVQHGTLVYLR